MANRVLLIQPKLLTQKELEKRLGVSDMAIDNWRKQDKYAHDPFPTDKTPTKGGYHRLRYDWIQVLYWLERNMPQRFLALEEKDKALIQGAQNVEYSRGPDLAAGGDARTAA